ncbi:MAG: hypothetical protein GXX85_01700 [Ignavibacteria bacterium]|nr:hypothetical protein [Ignavibacteria bacterium]
MGKVICIFIFLVVLQGCATVFSGYEDIVIIKNAPDSLKVSSNLDVNYPTAQKEAKLLNKAEKSYEVQKYLEIKLPKNKDHILILEDDKKIIKKEMNRKLSPVIFLLDAIFVLPAIYDGITGNWFYFDDIEYSELEK